MNEYNLVKVSWENLSYNSLDNLRFKGELHPTPSTSPHDGASVLSHSHWGEGLERKGKRCIFKLRAHCCGRGLMC